LVKSGPVAGLLGLEAVDRVEPDQRVVLVLALALAGLADGAGDRVTAAQAVAAHLRQGDVDVVRAGQVAGGADERVVVQHVEDAGDRQQDVVLADGRLVLVEPLAAVAPAVAVSVAAAPAAAAALEVVVVLVVAVVVAAVVAAVRAVVAAVGAVVRPAGALATVGAAVAVALGAVAVAVGAAALGPLAAVAAVVPAAALGAVPLAAVAVAVRCATGRRRPAARSRVLAVAGSESRGSESRCSVSRCSGRRGRSRDLASAARAGRTAWRARRGRLGRPGSAGRRWAPPLIGPRGAALAATPPVPALSSGPACAGPACPSRGTAVVSRGVPADWRAVIAATRSPLRIRAVPAMPSSVARRC
jgi:hypothetical protein